MEDQKITDQKISIAGKCRTCKITDLEHAVCLKATRLVSCRFSLAEEYLFRQKQKHNLGTNVIKHKGGFLERHTAIVLDTRSSAENDTSNII